MQSFQIHCLQGFQIQYLRGQKYFTRLQCEIWISTSKQGVQIEKSPGTVKRWQFLVDIIEMVKFPQRKRNVEKIILFRIGFCIPPVSGFDIWLGYEGFLHLLATSCIYCFDFAKRLSYLRLPRGRFQRRLHEANLSLIHFAGNEERSAEWNTKKGMGHIITFGSPRSTGQNV